MATPHSGEGIDLNFAVALAEAGISSVRTALKAEDYKFAVSLRSRPLEAAATRPAVVISAPKATEPPRIEDIVALFPRTMRAALSSAGR